MIKWIQTALELFTSKEPAWHAWFLSHVGVPGALLSYLLSGFAAVSPFSALEDGISVLELRSQFTRGQPIEKTGTLLLLDPVELEFSLPWKTQQSTPSLWSSVDKNILSQNEGRLRTENGSLQVRLPLLGVKGPVAVISDHLPGEQILFPGKRVSTLAFAPVPRRSVKLALTGVIFGMFGVGYSLGVTGGPPEEEKQ